eukprot:1161624-Pelagomonas_calceolata.AAC.7
MPVLIPIDLDVPIDPKALSEALQSQACASVNVWAAPIDLDVPINPKALSEALQSQACASVNAWATSIDLDVLLDQRPYLRHYKVRPVPPSMPGLHP